MSVESEFAVRVKNLSKVFRIYDRPSDRLKEAFNFSGKKYYSDYTVLDNISFDIKKGDFVGILGRNGAGKSTLLRLLSKELTPTGGEIKINGIVSLLQLGVGFDSELTGIENARFSSKLLGFSDDQVEKMLDDIIEFADIGEFIHHPVKTYSSGMYSRLSFAVGINVNPDILIADEVLSVGDARFSQKCLRKMHEIKDSGKTVILVTHSTSAVGVFCNKAIWLKDGKIFDMGEAKQVSENYNNWILYDKLPKHMNANPGIDSGNGNGPIDGKCQISNELQITTNVFLGDLEWEDISGITSTIGDGGAHFISVILLDSDTKKKLNKFYGSKRMKLVFKIHAQQVFEELNVGWLLNNQHGLPVLHLNNQICGKKIGPVKTGEEILVEFDFKFPALRNGTYIFAASLSIQDELNNTKIIQRVHDVYPLEISNDPTMLEQHGQVTIEEFQMTSVCSSAERGLSF